MKLKKLMLTGVLVCGLIFAGCDGDSGNSEKEEAVNSDIQEAWNDISGDSADEDKSEDDKPCFIEMTTDSILLVFDYDHCYIQKVNMNWSQK